MPGKLTFPNKSHEAIVEKNNLAPLRYVDDNHIATEQYPFNPNGSANGVAALTSYDGRHLAMMPHPERCYQYWQWPHKPNGYNPHRDMDKNILELGQGDCSVRGRIFPSPWLKLFQNAVDFCNMSGLDE